MPDELIRVLRDPWRCLRVLATALSIGGGVSPLGAQLRPVTKADILRAEDERGKGAEGIGPLIAGLRDPRLRETAIRAIGRLERPDLVRRLIPMFSDSAVRAAAAEALAQALQGLPPSARRTPVEKSLVDLVSQTLRSKNAESSDEPTLAAIAQSLGRLPYDDSSQARRAERFMMTLVPVWTPQTMEGVAHGLYSLARSRRTLGDLSPTTILTLRFWATAGRKEGGSRVQKPAWLALTASGRADVQAISDALQNDTVAQVRRLAVAGLPNNPYSPERSTALELAARDEDWTVRLEWVRVYRLLAAASDCKPLLRALNDDVHHVRLAAIDALGGACPERNAVADTLRRIIESGPSGIVPRPAAGVSWHAKAHALASLARIDAENGPQLLRRESRHPVWQVRMYVARAAAAIRDTALLTSMAFDSVGNVREVAIQGLSSTLGHVADLVYVRSLTSRDYHVVLAAARALKGAPVRDSVLPGVTLALERISREQRQTSRDPRMELLARVREFGDRETVPRLQGLLVDVDGAVATEAASVMNQLSGSDQFTSGFKRSVSPAMPAEGPIYVQVTMAATSGGGTFVLALDGDRAPWTTARMVTLIKNEYYDGLTFHRVVPNFVLQGGSPGMNEYVGDGPFMRDELSLAHHDRYTLGISTRGRDTGDAQWFINLVDNYRLDHDYTVVGRITRGFDVVDRIVEGDVMESVRILRPNGSTRERRER